MSGYIEPKNFEFVVKHIEDGNIFEDFAQSFLCAFLGESFIPLGGIHDKGMDGMDRCYNTNKITKTVYQISIEKDPKAKIIKTIKAIQHNKINCERLFYVTNQIVKDQYILENEIYENYNMFIQIRDLYWLKGNVNKNGGTSRAYLTFVETYYHQFTKGVQTFEFSDLHSDPRIFVYLRQQWEKSDKKTQLDELLADTLIIAALEGTDPDKEIFRTREEILTKASDSIQFSLDLLEPMIDQRLKNLAAKPNRKINYHSNIDAYCLPYETRLNLKEKNLQDAILHDGFFKHAEARLRKKLQEKTVRVRDVTELLQLVFNRLFKQQGLEFANFAIDQSSEAPVEKSLPDIISNTVDDSNVIPKNRNIVKVALLGTVREIIYQGSPIETQYLRSLSNSYMMLFLLQCDPKISVYFSTLANKLKVIVGNSILVPAISEWPLEHHHRRHWNLLRRAYEAGVTLFIDEETLNELASHFRQILFTYQRQYEGREAIFKNELAIMYIDEILIRSYFYGKLNDKLTTFPRFIDNFVSVNSSDPQHELLIWLKNTFGIKLLNDADVRIDQKEFEKLSEQLAQSKDKKLAQNDAKTILTIFGLRKLNKEMESGFGYQTWWLSKDTKTQKAVVQTLGKKYQASAYMRADFLNNYIVLSPNLEKVNRTFDEMFPTLIGVSISRHIPPELVSFVQKEIQDHASKDPARVMAVITMLTDKLKSEEVPANKNLVTHYLDDLLDEIVN
jgi:hypothetical protein